MNISYHVMNTTFSDGMRTYADEKLEKLGRHLDQNATIDVRMKIYPTEENPAKVEITYQDPQAGVIRAECRGKDMYALIDQATRKMARNLQKAFDRKVERHRQPIKNEDRGDKVLIKQKLHKLESITKDEACEAMELTDHSFYVYLDRNRNDAVCAVYVREDGNYGMLVFE